MGYRPARITPQFAEVSHAPYMDRLCWSVLAGQSGGVRGGPGSHAPEFSRRGEGVRRCGLPGAGGVCRGVLPPAETGGSRPPNNERADPADGGNIPAELKDRCARLEGLSEKECRELLRDVYTRLRPGWQV